MNKLGFGFLRLPRINPEDEKSINYELLNQMTDAFLAGGRSYFDTAYTYLGGLSEHALKKCLVERHPRASFRIADKMPTWKVKKQADLRLFFEEQKQRCGVDFFDVYLLHSLNRENYETAEKFEMFSFLQEIRASSEAKKIGFSYHDSPDLLDEILTKHPCVDYVQLQINYLDWHSPSLQAQQLYETAARHGKKIIVMEPVKGGSLASLPEKETAKLRCLDPDASIASWAIRFAQSLPEVEIVLSGMNTMEQLSDNLKDAPPLAEKEIHSLMDVADSLRSTIAIPCTGCAYCTEHCPMNIPIPQYFALYNEYVRAPREVWKMQHVYDRLAENHGRASDCITCGQCAQSCPQRIEIPGWMEKVAIAFGEELQKAVDRVRNSPGVRKK